MDPLVTTLLIAVASPAAPVDLSRYSKDCGVDVQVDGERITAAWPMEGGESGRVVIDLRAEKPLVESIAVVAAGAASPILEGVWPFFHVTEGTRVAPSGRPPDMSPWNTFFDNPAKRPHRTRPSTLGKARARVESDGRRARIAVGDLSVGSFDGEVVFTFFPGARIFRVEAAVSTSEDGLAIIYDAGWTGPAAAWRRLAWMDTEGKLQSSDADAKAPRRIAVRHRTIVAEQGAGALACFPSPHQFQFPRDWTDNLRFVWVGSPGEARGPDEGELGIGVCQDAAGGGAFVPWFNAPPGTRQRWSFFSLLSRGGASDALRETLRFTHGDRFPALPGRLTFTSHWHMAIAVASMAEVLRKQSPPPVPGFVDVFKGLGVDIVHLAEFHGDGHPDDPGPLRLPELDAMFGECRRLSDAKLLLIPGEEGNKYLGLPAPGRHPGHWMSLFPRPVHWTMTRGAGEPFVTDDPARGKVYRVGSREDMVELLRREGGLAWTAHPRIKASSWCPDVFRQEDFYLSERWLGAAWKAMPGDLSRERQGERALDLLDDMSNWAASAPPSLPASARRKCLPGEVDVFKIDSTHELYAHMNVNYLKLDRLPRYEDGWQPVLDALRAGSFFVTTGEVLLRDFTLGGKASGETLRLAADGRAALRVELEWTFPLELGLIVTGDGAKVEKERIPLADTGPFGSRVLERSLDLRGKKWLRFEVWDTAAGGAFTQPVWLE